ncbi:MAG: endonuclease/exonuclease/phosphatase family protein, partial [Acidobacteriota bacterium]|nr:endonuclease/exonuclease/phosphatase family protein [Acidobacteriota bacterium]
YMIYPYTIFARQQVQNSVRESSDASCRLLFANVLMSNRDAERLRRIIREQNPDVILTVETDRWWQEQLKEFELTHPHTVHCPLENTYGMLLYSRLELVRPEVKFIVEVDIPSIHALMKLPNGKEVEIHCLHPRPPFPTEAMQSTERDAELLIVGRGIKKCDTPVIVMGDLNDVAWSRTNYLFQDISGLLDPRIGRGFFNTFHAQYPIIRFPLDHFFHSNHFRLMELKRLGRFGSDHFPVLIALSYESDATSEQAELQPDTAQVEEAEEKIDEALKR